VDAAYLAVAGFIWLCAGITRASVPIQGPIPGDVAPRGAPDGQLNVADVLVLERFILGQATPTPAEKWRCDVAPLGHPDGMLNVADLLLLQRAVLGQIDLPPLIQSSIPPSAPVAKDIFVSSPVNGQVQVTGNAGASQPDTQLVITNYSTGAQVTTTVGSDGSFSVTIGAVTGQVLKLVVVDATGVASASTPIGVGQIIALSVLTPGNGVSIASDQVNVSGTFTGPPNTAITVNGEVAALNGNSFYATNVPLDSGSNVLSVVASISDGITATTIINVTSTAIDLVKIISSATSGFAPLTTSFSIENNTGRALVFVSADFDGDGTTDFSGSDTRSAITYTYALPGVYQASFSVRDDQGHVYSQIIPIVVTASASLDSSLRGVYNNMLTRLRVGAIDGALNAITGGAHDKYLRIFTALSGDMPVIVDQLGTLGDGVIGPDMAEYVVTRTVSGQPRSFLIYFIRGEDGVWRIDEM